MRVVIYARKAGGMSGITTFELNFIHFLKNHGVDVVYVYDFGEPKELLEWGIECTKNTTQQIECDVCVYSSILRGQHNIKAKKYVQMVHTDIHHWRFKLNPEGIDVIVAVGPGVQRSLKEHFDIDSIVIPNMIPKPKTRKVLRLMCASRISKGKGFDRIKILVDKFRKADIPFIFEIYGVGSMEDEVRKIFSDYLEVHFCGVASGIQSYMLANDYVVQLSDSEGFCYSIYEALQVGVPVIVTQWEGLDPNVTGFKLPMDMIDVDVHAIYDSAFEKKACIERGTIVELKNAEARGAWEELLNLQNEGK